MSGVERMKRAAFFCALFVMLLAGNVATNCLKRWLGW